MRQLVPDELSSELERHCEYYQQRVMRRLVNLGHGKERAEDYCQDTFLRAWKHIQLQDTPLPQTDYHLENWLRIIAERIAIDENRRTKKIGFIYLPENEAYPSSPEPSVDEEAGIITRLDLRKDLAQMPLRYQQCVLMIERGFEQKDIAKELGISESTVSKILRKVKTQLQPQYYPAVVSVSQEVLSLCRDVEAYYGGIPGSSKVSEVEKIGTVPPFEMKQRIERLITEVDSYANRVNNIWRKLGNKSANRVNNIYRQLGYKYYPEEKGFLVLMELEKVVAREQGYLATYPLVVLDKLCLDQINLRTCREYNERFERDVNTGIAGMIALKYKLATAAVCQ